MKKIFIAMMAMAAFAACATEDTIVTPQGAAIAFGDAFVDNATKAIYESAEAITCFTVFGNVVATADVDTAIPVALYGNGAAVTRDGAALGAAWTCDVTRYWTPSCTFNFAAIANGTATEIVEGLPTEISYTIDADDPADLIYATASATTEPDCTPSVASGIVPFTFNHLLAKMYFNVTSGLDPAYSIEVKSISVTGFENKGVYTISPAGWAKAADSAAETTLTFANGEDGAKVIIPVNQTLSVIVTYDVKFGGTTISTDATKTGTIAQYTYKENTVYKISAAIDLNEIQFTTTALSGFGSPEQDGTVTIQ